MKTIRRAVYAIEKVIVVMSLLACLGFVGDMGNYGYITLENYRIVIMYCAILGLFLGLSYKIFEIDKLRIQYAYLIHFSLGFITLVVVESFILRGTIIPGGYIMDYVLKLVLYFVAYTIVSILEYLKTKWEVNKMNIKIKEV